ncbi:MAG: hypothetical protein KJO76_06105 [Gammaproteobacteria bacterium]|nr:hypothetical protein [Gammaproteobacteria bacterium]MBT8444736.1 hypothetical protein [Gammaproteobacteria bacterium]NND37860.1 hypothetical protein [Gammaproteobacteria bacterium]
MLSKFMRRLVEATLATLLLTGSLAIAAAPEGVGELAANEAERESATRSRDDDGEVIELDANEAEAEAASDSDENAVEDLLAEVAFGEPVDCVNTQRIRRTEILSDREILFFMHGSEVRLNKLPHRCAGLRRADTFSYEVRGSQLCHIDLIRVVDNFGGRIRPGVACGLGKFLPVDVEQVPLIREQAKARAKAGK